MVACFFKKQFQKICTTFHGKCWSLYSHYSSERNMKRKAMFSKIFTQRGALLWCTSWCTTSCMSRRGVLQTHMIDQDKDNLQILWKCKTKMDIKMHQDYRLQTNFTSKVKSRNCSTTHFIYHHVLTLYGAFNCFIQLFKKTKAKKTKQKQKQM